MGNHTLFVDKEQGQQWLADHHAKLDIPLTRRCNGDNIYVLPDGSVIQEHDAAGERYTLDMVTGNQFPEPLFPAGSGKL